MSIITRNITKVYGTQTVLDSVSFSIGKGQIVGLLGPNGAGKSTLMKILTCFIPPTSGDASILGHDVMMEPEEVKKRVGYLPENNPLYVDMYIKEYLEFMAGLHKLGKNSGKRIEEMIELTGLGPEQYKRIGTLSKGYRQRVGLAQALIHNPDVLILDEPTSGLDPNQILEIRNLILEIGKDKTVLFSTHIMQEVEAICNRAIIIDKGKIVADSPTSELKSVRNQDFITIEFASAVTQHDLMQIKGVVKATNLKENSWRLQAETGVEIRPLINKFAIDKKLTILSLQKEKSTLERTFQELTGKLKG